MGPAAYLSYEVLEFPVSALLTHWWKAARTLVAWKAGK